MTIGPSRLAFFLNAAVDQHEKYIYRRPQAVERVLKANGSKGLKRPTYFGDLPEGTTVWVCYC